MSAYIVRMTATVNPRGVEANPYVRWSPIRASKTELGHDDQDLRDGTKAV